MKAKRNKFPIPFVTHRSIVLPILVFIALISLASVPLLSSASSSFRSDSAPKPKSATDTLGASGTLISDRLFKGFLNSGKTHGLLNWSAPVAETIATFAADCTTPKTTFVLGEGVCAKTDGVNLTEGRFVNWFLDTTVVSGGSGVTDITTNPQTFSYIPTAVGGYKAAIATPTDSSETPADFTVTEAPPIATYDGSCTTLKSTFNLNDVVCVKVNGVPVNPVFPNKIAWVDPAGLIEQKTELTTDPQTDTFQLPTTDTSTLFGLNVENRGTWRVDVTRNNGRLKESAHFSVANAANPAAHLVLHKFVEGLDGTVQAGGDLAFILSLTNKGPDAAETVVLSDPTPANTTLSSFTMTSGPAGFTCSGNDCSIASLASGETAEFRAVYTVISGVPGGTTITNIAVVTSPTVDTDDATRTSSARAQVINPGNQATCVLECPGNITVSSTSAAGAVVTFDGGEPTGSCGTLSSTPASGSTFPVGSTVVTTSSSTGGGSCSFLVTVVDAAPPTIECPLPDLTGTATGANTETNVSVSTPAATGNNVVVSGTRSDNRGLSDPYPVGTTFISWVATEFFGDDPGRQVSCSQKVIVTSADAPTISCPSNKSFAAESGCERTLTAEEIGSPTATGSNVVITTRRSDDRALTDPFPAGTTVITWTATDDGGRVASCTQTITISSASDNTPPTLNVPGPVSISTTSCSALLDDELGVATATDDCSGVTISRSGVPKVPCASNPNGCETFIFPTGTTTITYTATDASGNVATGTQLVTVTEFPAVAPTVTAPADLNLNTGAGATSCGLVVSDATLGTALTDDNCPGETVVRTGVPAGNFFPIGPTVITYTVTDASGNVAQDTQTVTVTDNTIPTIGAPADVTLYTGAGATSCSVTVADLDATLGTATTGDNCPGAITVARGNVPAGNVFPLGDTIVSYTATDANGNSSAPVTQKVTVVDNTPPTISCPSNITVNLPLNSTATSMAVTYPAATASDNCPGTPGITYSQDSGTVFPVGPTTVTATATDAHGNTSSCTFVVTVIYNFTGFFNPVNNPPTVNNVNAGRSLPLKFSLSGAKGLNIFAVGYPASQHIACDSSAPLADLEGTNTPGGSTLTYSPDQYHYNWKTESGWAGTCRVLVVKLNDGTEHTALFKFK